MVFQICHLERFLEPLMYEESFTGKLPVSLVVNYKGRTRYIFSIKRKLHLPHSKRFQLFLFFLYFFLLLNLRKKGQRRKKQRTMVVVVV